MLNWLVFFFIRPSALITAKSSFPKKSRFPFPKAILMYCRTLSISILSDLLFNSLGVNVHTSDHNPILIRNRCTRFSLPRVMANVSEYLSRNKLNAGSLGDIRAGEPCPEKRGSSVALLKLLVSCGGGNQVTNFEGSSIPSTSERSSKRTIRCLPEQSEDFISELSGLSSG